MPKTDDRKTVISVKEYNHKSVQNTMDASYQPPIMKDCIQKELDFLDALEWEGKKVMDIGCGTGRHGNLFGESCFEYLGVEICEDMVEATQENWSQMPHANVVHTNAAEYEYTEGEYDRAMSLWFTPGNFRKDNFDVENYSEDEINKNPQFIAIVSGMYKSLKPGGHVLLTVYKDIKETQDMQINWYTRTGQQVVSSRKDPFTATKEGFWSLRFTEERMMSNLSSFGVNRSQVTFHDLNSISWIVEIRK